MVVSEECEEIVARLAGDPQEVGDDEPWLSIFMVRRITYEYWISWHFGSFILPTLPPEVRRRFLAQASEAGP